MWLDGLITGYNYIWRSFTCTLIKLYFLIYFSGARRSIGWMGAGYWGVSGGSEGGRQGLLKKNLFRPTNHVSFFLVSPSHISVPEINVPCILGVPCT